MLFGDKDHFAIDTDVEPHLRLGSHVWGRMGVWVRGSTLGRIDEGGCLLSLSRDALVWLSDHIEELWDEELVGLDDSATFAFLNANLYGVTQGGVAVPTPIVSDDAQSRLQWARWKRFEFLTNWGEQFDGFKAFLVRPPGGPLRVLSRSLPARLGTGVEVEPNAFRAAVSGFAEWFDTKKKQLGG